MFTYFCCNPCFLLILKLICNILLNINIKESNLRNKTNFKVQTNYFVHSIFYFVAPFEINITARGVQEVGESLTLDCTITDTGRVGNPLDIRWIYDTTVLRRNTVMPTTANDSFPFYMDSYTIDQLSTSYEGRMIQCIANRTDPSTIDSYAITLDVTGKLKDKAVCALCFIHMYLSACNCIVKNIYLLTYPLIARLVHSYITKQLSDVLICLRIENTLSSNKKN